MSAVYEFVVYVQFVANGKDDAVHQLSEWLHRPDPDCYAIGAQNYEPRQVAEDDH